MFGFIKKIFSSDSINNEVKSLNINEEYYSRFVSINDGLGEYSNLESINEEIEIKGNQYLNQIEYLENKIMSLNDSSLFFQLGLSYYNYSKWYKRGQSKKEYLEKSVLNLKKSIEIDNNIKSREKLGAILIKENLVKDLKQGINILTTLEKKGDLPYYLEPLLLKAKRTTSNATIYKNYNFCKFKNPTPALLREDRVYFRGLIRKLKKEKDTESLKKVLNDYYKLGILATMCYPNHDCNSAVSGQSFDSAISIVKSNCKKLDYSYIEHGQINNCDFISKNDWKNFEKVFGKNTDMLSLNS